ncbi:MAG TPA: protein translocase subunit SecD [Firmicutes bacterium]|nr:protein translocase subunit SecD [Bacillota bacterium]
MNRNRLLVLLLVCVLLVGGSALAVWQAATKMKLGLDLRGGVYVLYRAVETEEGTDSTDKLDRAITVIRNRIDALGVTEPVIQREGNDRIRVELPGINDQRKAREVIGKTALLKFVGPDGETIVEGDELDDARAAFDEYGMPAVSLKFNAAGTEKFAEATEKFLYQPIAIYLDEEEISAPTVNAVIASGEALITNVGTIENAAMLALQLRSGALPVQLEEMEIRGVGPQLGRDSLNRSVYAGVAGLILVLLFMLVYYRAFGLVADIALITYAAIVLGILTALNVTLTLPGIAGLILSVGMAVDANVIIFERIKEELRNGRTLRTAIEAGFKEAFRAIFDSNVTTLIAAAVLFKFATGPVRGFAVTLSIGILASMFTAVVLTRYLLRLLAGTGLLKATPAQTAKTVRTDFARVFKYAVLFSALLFVAGIISLSTQALNYGIDFTGGTIIQLDLGRPFTLEEVRETLEPLGLSGAQLQKVGAEGPAEGEAHEVLMRTPELSATEQDNLFAAFRERYGLPEEALLRVENVGAVVGSELQRQALVALLIASVGMVLYITVRFEYRFAVAAIITLLHDVLMMLVFFSFLRLEVNSTFIAAVLTIVGYSINDTIVIYDRIRENLKRARKEELAAVVNDSIRQTLVRSVNTSLTTQLVLLTLLIFGGVTLRPFVTALVIGVIFGLYSSVFLAAPLWLWWRERSGRKAKTA